MKSQSKTKRPLNKQYKALTKIYKFCYDRVTGIKAMMTPEEFYTKYAEQLVIQYGPIKALTILTKSSLKDRM